jgi:hypothetical protein
MHPLKRIAIAVSTLFMSPAALAADCVFETDRVDPFTQRAVVVTDWEEMTKDVSNKFKHPKGFISARRDGNQKTLAIRMRTWSKSSPFQRNVPGPRPSDGYLYNALVADEGSKLLLLLADETIVELYTDRTIRGISDSAGVASSEWDSMSRITWDTYDIRGIITLRYPLDDDAYTALSSYPVKNIRLSTNGRDHDFKLRNETYGGVSRALACLGQDTVAEEAE